MVQFHLSEGVRGNWKTVAEWLATATESFPENSPALVALRSLTSASNVPLRIIQPDLEVWETLIQIDQKNTLSLPTIQIGQLTLSELIILEELGWSLGKSPKSITYFVFPTLEIPFCCPGTVGAVMAIIQRARELDALNHTNEADVLLNMTSFVESENQKARSWGPIRDTDAHGAVISLRDWLQIHSKAQ